MDLIRRMQNRILVTLAQPLILFFLSFNQVGFCSTGEPRMVNDDICNSPASILIDLHPNIKQVSTPPITNHYKSKTIKLPTTHTTTPPQQSALLSPIHLVSSKPKKQTSSLLISQSTPQASSSGIIRKWLTGLLQEQDSGPMICTDRNSVTPHPNAVPLGYLQFESGMTLDRFHKGGDMIVPETFARLGTWKDGEVRFQVPNYVRSTGVEGTSDIQVSIKQDVEPGLLNKKGVDLGVITGLSLPTGSKSLSTGAVDPFVQMIAFYKFHKNHTIGTSHSIFMPTVIDDDPIFGSNKERNVTYQPTVILFRHLSDFRSPERIDIWAEYAGQFYKNGPSSQIIDFGGVWRPYQRHQVDFRFGFGLTSAAPRAFIGFGYSWLAGKVIPFYKKHPDHLYRP